MSDYYNKPILKATRNKYPSNSRQLAEPDVEDKTKRAYKRQQSDEDKYYAKRKKYCQEETHSESSTRNLANNRLKVLRETLNADVKHASTRKEIESTSRNLSSETEADTIKTHTPKKLVENPMKIISNNLRDPAKNRKDIESSASMMNCNENDKRKCRNIGDTSNQCTQVPNQNKYDTKCDHTFTTPSPKNLANDRLKRLRKSFELKDNDNGSKTQVKNIFNTPNQGENLINSGLNKKPLVLNRSTVNPSGTSNIFTRPSPTNLANDRLNRLRNNLVLNSTIQSPNSSIGSVIELSSDDGESPVKNIQPSTLFSNNIDHCQASNQSESDVRGTKRGSFENNPTTSTPLAKRLRTMRNEYNLENTINKEVVKPEEKVNSWLLNTEERDSSTFNVTAATNDSILVHLDDTVKSNLVNEVEPMNWETGNETNSTIIEVPTLKTKASETGVENEPANKNICVVIDTNIFISNLKTLQSILNCRGTDECKPIIYIPWMVIAELDSLKMKSDSVRRNAADAINFINKNLRGNQSRLVGQSVEKATIQKHIGNSPDDKIMSCCLQAQEEYETVILCSDDTNLRNKALINNISACSHKDALMVIMSKMNKNIKYQKIVQKCGVKMSLIICECAKEAYGSVWNKMDMLKQPPPWSLKECLMKFRKYWSAVFRQKLLKQFLTNVNDLFDILDMHCSICDGTEQYKEFKKLILGLCFYLKDIEDSRPIVQNLIEEITRIDGGV